MRGKTNQEKEEFKMGDRMLEMEDKQLLIHKMKMLLHKEKEMLLGMEKGNNKTMVLNNKIWGNMKERMKIVQ